MADHQRTRRLTPQDVDVTERLPPAEEATEELQRDPEYRAAGEHRETSERATTTVTDPRAATDGRGPPADGDRPRLADGVELLGRYEDSGFNEPPFMARRPDGQIVQLAPLLYLVAERSNGQNDHAAIAQELTQAFRRQVEPDDVRFLVQQKLTPLGLMVMPDGKAPQVQKLDPLLALKFRAAVVPKGMVRAVTTVFKPLFFPLFMVAVLAALIAFDYWLFGVHGVAQGVRASLYRPALLLLVLGCVVLSAAFHEIGHATACRYGGAEPGVMGVGIYVVWPAFYTDVTDAYRLGKGGRLRTDVGGLYFNAIVVLSVAAIFFLGGFEALLLIAVILQIQMIPQLMPFLRMDGYYMVADLTGVPDLFTRIKSILLSLIPWRKTDERVKELKPWVRLAVTAWVLVVVPLLLFNLALVVISAPRIFATAWDSFFVHWGRVSTAFGSGRVSAGLLGSVQMGALVLPAAGITYSAGRLSKRAATGAWRWSANSPIRRGAALFGVAAVVGVLAYVWWPNGDYRPIQPGERWTAGQLVSAVKDVASGRPALSLQQQARTVVPAPRTNVQPTPGASPSPAPGASPTSGTSSGSTGSSPTPSPGAEPSPTSSPSPSPSPSP